MMTIDYENPWSFNGKPFDTVDIKNYVGFVYVILSQITGQYYIGRKYFFTHRKKTGATRRSKAESDWKKYYGSSTAVKMLIEKKGVDNYQRDVLRLCKTKGECSYYEAKLQFEYDVLLNDDFYNEFIGCKIHSKHIRTNDDSD